MGPEFQSRRMKRVLKRDGGGSFRTRGRHITPQAVKMVKTVNVPSCVFYYNKQRKGRKERKTRRKGKGKGGREEGREGGKEMKLTHLLLVTLISQMEMVP